MDSVFELLQFPPKANLVVPVLRYSFASPFTTLSRSLRLPIIVGQRAPPCESRPS